MTTETTAVRAEQHVARTPGPREVASAGRRQDNLYVELAGDGWGWGRKELKNSCAALVRRYPSLQEQAAAAETSVEQFLFDVVFADLLPANFALAKLTFPRDDKWGSVNVSLRLSADSRPNWPLPKGVSLVAKASWSLGGTDPRMRQSFSVQYPVIKVFSFHDGPAGAPREFEAPLDVICRQATRAPKGAAKERNALSGALARTLPAISEETAARLKDWADFLDWKRRLVYASRTAVRYVSRAMSADSRSITFKVVGGSQSDLEQALRKLSQDVGLAAFDLSLSEDPWQYRLATEGREPRGVEIGNASRGRPRFSSEVQLSDDCPWPSPVTADVKFSLPDDVMASIELSDDAEKVAERSLARIPEAGFIVQSAVQDLSQVNRQARALSDLSDQGGFSPYLARYMFDAAEARVPARAGEVGSWFNTRLNDAQRSAVQKVIAAPDLCLIQGPPGTGKTTVIAESIAQVVARNETVLLASQTHTAVDNALSRLPLHPSIRAVRLTRNVDRLSEEGQEFLNDRALFRYYRSLSQAVEARRDEADGQRSFAAQVSAFRREANSQLERLEAAEREAHETQGGLESADGAVEAALEELRSWGVATPIRSAASEAEFDEWSSELNSALPAFVAFAAATRDGRPLPELRAADGRRTALEQEHAAILDRLRTDDTALADLRRIRSALDDLGSPAAQDGASLMLRYFPDARPMLEPPSSWIKAALTKGKRAQNAAAMLSRFEVVERVLLRLQEGRAIQIGLLPVLADSTARLEAARAGARAHFESQSGRLIGIVPAPPNSDAARMRASLEEAEARSADRITQAMRLAAESEVWGDIQEDWVRDLSSDDVAARDWDAIGDDWLAECNVVGVTCNENPGTLDEPGLTNFDLAIVDEVSKATPLELLLPLMRARRSALVGDHRQLPPMFREGQDAEAIADEPDEDVPEELALTPENLRKYEKFVTASLFRTHFERADDSIKQRLTVQHRMHPDIMDSVNRFYEGQLTSGIADPDLERAHGLTIRGRGDLPVINPDQHMVWIDTTHDDRGDPWTEPQAGSGKERTNELEARLIVRMLRDIDDELSENPLQRGKVKDVGIVSMYQAQVRCIREEIKRETKDRPFKAIKYELNTVVKYQGKEKPIILVSMVRNYGSRASNRRRSSRANVARFEYINVAFSRAQELLVVFGARDTFAPYSVELPPMDATGSPTTADVYREITESIERRGALKQASALGELVSRGAQR